MAALEIQVSVRARASFVKPDGFARLHQGIGRVKVGQVNRISSSNLSS